MPSAVVKLFLKPLNSVTLDLWQSGNSTELSGIILSFECGLIAMSIAGLNL